MNTALRLSAFGASLAAVFAAAYGVGSATGPVDDADPGPAEHAAHTPDPGPSAVPAEAGTPGGLQVAERGYTLALRERTHPTGRAEPFRFTITGPRGTTLNDYKRVHGKELHLIVARRDLSGFQHIHPTRDAAGTWSVPLKLRDPGEYRVFADFTPAGDKRGGLTLGADLAAAGDYRPRKLPAPERTAEVDGYTVTLRGALRSGASDKLTLSVARNGKPVTNLQPYLGAYGHLVALRSGDLAYLHVHPDAEASEPETEAGPEVAFHVEAPSSGTYRLYLDFKHEGKVRTAEFTVTAGKPAAAGKDPAPAQSPRGEDDGDGHGDHGGH